MVVGGAEVGGQIAISKHKVSPVKNEKNLLENMLLSPEGKVSENKCWNVWNSSL